MDLAVAPFVFTPSRAKAVQFLFPLEEADHSFIIKVPTENTLTMYLRPFQVTGMLFVKMISKITRNLICLLMPCLILLARLVRDDEDLEKGKILLSLIIGG